MSTGRSETITSITLPQPFVPPSLQDPSRPSPSVPSGLPQLPVDETPLKVADAVCCMLLHITFDLSLRCCVLKDLRTPDNWVKRNPKLIRLTGQHPFNVEPDLDELFNAVRVLCRSPDSRSEEPPPLSRVS